MVAIRSVTARSVFRRPCAESTGAKPRVEARDARCGSCHSVARDYLGSSRSAPSGTGFDYVDPQRARHRRSARARSAFDALRVPPAWRDVHIARSPRSAIQAWGFDARGRKQYRYNDRAVERRELRKHHRVRQLAKELPRLRRTMEPTPGPRRALHALDADTVAATVLRVISETFCRVGGERYIRENGTFGITTLRKSHVESARRQARLEYKRQGEDPAATGRDDRELVRLIAAPASHAGNARVRAISATARWRAVSARDVNAYLRRRAAGTARRTSERGAERCAPRRCSPSWAARNRHGGEAQRRARDAARVVGARQHAGDLSSVVRPPDGDRALSRRGRDDPAAATTRRRARIAAAPTRRRSGR